MTSGDHGCCPEKSSSSAAKQGSSSRATAHHTLRNKMGNPSNGPAVVKWLNIFAQTLKDFHLVTIISVDIKDLNNDGLDDYYCSM